MRATSEFPHRATTKQALLLALLFCQSLLLSTGCGGCADPTPNEPVDNFFEPIDTGIYDLVLEPQIDVPARVDFGFLEDGERVEEVILVKNEGRAPLSLISWTMTNDAFKMSFPDFMSGEVPKRLEPGESIRVRLDYTSVSDAPVEGELVIESDDPKRSEARVDLTANVLLPCLHVDKEELDFGLVAPGEARTARVVVRNCSDVLPTSFRVDEIMHEGDVEVFTVDNVDVRGETIELRPELWLELNITFAPKDPGAYAATIDIVSDDLDEGVAQVELFGEGAPYRCPRAILTARNDETGEEIIANPSGRYDGIPLDTLSLDALASQSYDGAAIERAEWSLVRRPADSGAAFAQGSSSTRNQLFLDLTGEYRIEMHVWNSRGTRSCQPATLDISAIPDEDIHIQLVWDTPNDGNQFDSFGSDVDLHLLRSGGTWNFEPWDCFWQNLEPDWGRPFSRDDNPSLDIDDTNGWGPENINLNNPEDGQRYHIGVHYFSDHGYGVSFATVRLYLGGRFEREYRRQRLTDQEFWHVLDVDWPEGTVTEFNDMYSTFPSGVFRP